MNSWSLKQNFSVRVWVTVTLYITGLLFFGHSSLAHAQVLERLSAQKLRGMGIFTTGFRLVTFSRDNSMLLCTEKPRFVEKMKGITYKLWVFYLDSSGKLIKSKAIPLTIPSALQTEFTPDERKAVIITDAGATYIVVDLSTGKVENLMVHVKGKPGFRGYPPILWRQDGTLLTTGYFYDKDDYAGNDTIATVDVTKRGVDAFTPGLNVAEIHHKAGRVHFGKWTGVDRGFIGVDIPGGGQVLKYWSQDKGFREVSRTSGMFLSLWAEGDRAVVALQEGDGINKAVLYDVARGRSWVLGTSRDPYGYCFLSKDGTTAIACKLDLPHAKMSVYYAKEDNEFKLEPVPELQDTRIGTLRVAPDGSRLAHFSAAGLSIVALP